MENINLFVSIDNKGRGLDKCDSDYGYGYGYGDGYGNGNDNGNGYGNGNGNGGGNGNGNGHGYGDGYGDGFGSGFGGGNGHGYGNGSGNGGGNGGGSGGGGISKFSNKIVHETVHMIDGVPTIITRLKDNIAKGFILNQDFSLTKCYIVKRDNFFAHGETLRNALKSLQDKIIKNMNIEEKIKMFLEEFNLTDKYPSMKFFEWHNKLTGSCEMGRKAFAKKHNIDLEKDTFTVSEFIELTENDYGSKVIKRLKERIK